MKEQVFIKDSYVDLTAGQDLLLLPFGPIVRNGKTRHITPEYAGRFKLPDYEPAVKMGSHKDETPAGGFIKNLEVRENGLWATVEYNEVGTKAITDGAYRYLSPEIIWPEGGVEDVRTGEMREGPFIVGTALLHDPALGNEVAIYEIEIKETHMEDNTMSEETMVVPASLVEKFTAMIDRLGKPQEPEDNRDDFEAIEKERDNFKAQLDQLQADKEQAEAFAVIRAGFETDEYGAAFTALLGTNETAVNMLASMPVEARAWVMQNFQALSGQIDESALLGETGSTAEGGDNASVLEGVIEDYQKEGLSYIDAFNKARTENTELFSQGGK